MNSKNTTFLTKVFSFCAAHQYGNEKWTEQENWDVFGKPDWNKGKYKNPFLDKSSWEVVDSAGNLFNRLVIFKSSNVHAVTEYFGETIENSRLFQLFFFNIVV